MLALLAQYPDAVGWIALPNTEINYPFAQHKNNDYYLRRDLKGEYAAAGTIFMDSRCERDFTSQNTILYGHHMKNGSMFGTLKMFGEASFFDTNASGTIYLPNDTLTLAFFAFLVVDPGAEKATRTHCVSTRCLCDSSYAFVCANSHGNSPASR